MNDILDILREWSSLAHDNESKFLDTFASGDDSWILTKLSWNDEKMHFTYILNTGQHICDSAKIEEWFKFLNELNK